MINWNQFTISNEAITDLRELMFLTVFEDADLERTISNRTGVVDGKKLGFIDNMGLVGKSNHGCNPKFDNVEVTGLEKKWELGDWQIAKKLCYDDLENTLAKYGMNAGTEAADLQGTPYWTKVLMPLLERAMKDMFWRIVWMADKDAANVEDGGVIKTGLDPKYFNMCEGLWKRIFSIAAANNKQYTEIGANGASTQTLQKQYLNDEGIAIKLMDNILSDADSRIWYDPAASVFMTDSFFRALRRDVANKYTKTTMPFEQIAAGLAISEYDGRRIIVLQKWDDMIGQFEDNGIKLNLPHRVLCASPNNLFAGTNDTDKVANLDIWFEKKTRENHIFAESKIGTLVGEDSLIHVAY